MIASSFPMMYEAISEAKSEGIKWYFQRIRKRFIRAVQDTVFLVQKTEYCKKPTFPN